MLHAGHFAIYLQAREQQLGIWQLAEPFVLRCNGGTSTEWENWSCLWIWGQECVNCAWLLFRGFTNRRGGDPINKMLNSAGVSAIDPALETPWKLPIY